MRRTKNTSRIAIGVSMAAMLVLGVVGQIVPAFAGHADGTANVDVHEILAGRPNQLFTINVTHPAAPGTGGLLQPPSPDGLNWVQITTPPQFVALASGHTMPSGWTATVFSFKGVPRTVVFQQGTGTAIAPGGNANFGVAARVPTPPADFLGEDWYVESSSDGATNSIRTPTGNLETNVRVLKVSALGITSPQGAVDAIVTGNQVITAACTVENYASGAMTVTPSISGSNFTIEQAPSAASIPAGGSHVFPFTLKTADVTTLQNSNIACNADGTNSAGGTATTPSGFNLQIPLTIQPRAIFNYVSSQSPPSMSPRSAAPGTPVSFTVLVQKTPANSPVVSLDTTRTNFSLKDSAGTVVYGPQGLASSNTVPAGVASNFSLQFAQATVPNVNGVFSAVLNVAGTDENGAAVSFEPVPNFNETIRLDNLLPTVDLGLRAPAKPANFTGTGDHTQVPAAYRNTQVMTVGGSVKDTDTSGNANAPCPGTGSEKCTIESALLYQFDGFSGGAQVGTPKDLKGCLSIDASGNINSSSCSPTIDAGTKSVVLEMIVKDPAGNFSAATLSKDIPTSNLQGRIDVDLLAPQLSRAVTARTYADETTETGEMRRTLHVFLDECVGGATTARDWIVEGAGSNQWIVTDATPTTDCKVIDLATRQFEGKVTLTVTPDFPDDNSTAVPLTSVTYNPGAIGGTGNAGRFFDRTNQQIVVPAQKNILDGIAPLKPVISHIKLAAGKVFPTQDGAFWTNVDAPELLIVNPANQPNRAVKPGYTIEVWQETNGANGLQRTDNEVAGKNKDSKLGEKVVPTSNPTEAATYCPAASDPGAAQPSCVFVTADFANGDATDTSTTDKVHGIYAVSLDGALNISKAATANLEIDRILPAFVPDLLETQPSAVIVPFDDSLARGSNSPGHWTLFNTLDRRAGVASVEGVTGSAHKRKLNMSGPNYDPAQLMFIDYRAVSGVRYEDRATNLLNDFSVCLKIVADSLHCSS